jgi:phytoene synthase
MREHFAHCAELVRAMDRDRYLATLFAPAEKRDALLSLFAFDIEITRIRDVAREPLPGEIRLQWWREVLGGERAGEAAAHPIAAAMLEILSHYKLAREPLTDLIEARRFDIYDEPMSSFSEFHSYAAATAGTVFKFAACILIGDVSPEVVELAADAGRATTIANVLALLPRHSARRQLFVPVEMLRHYGAEPEEIFAMRATPEFRAALAELRLRARRDLARIGTGSPQIPENARPAFLSLAPLRQWLLDMERADYDPFQPPVVSSWRRQWRIWRAAKSPERIG